MTAPLKGIRVIDWTHVLAGPACAYYLGQLGADVIKVEKPGRGDAMRHRGGSDAKRAADGMSTAFMTQAAGKQSLAVDLETPNGRDVFEKLLQSADVLVENHRPSTLKRLGLTEQDTRAINPKLIHCAMTGYGRGNTMSEAPAYDVNIQAISGLMALTGTQDTGPIRTGAPIIDYATGLAGALGVMSALMSRQHTGEGRFVDVSMLETAFALMSSTVTDFSLTGTEPKPRGNAANSRSPSSGAFVCKEGHISLGVNEDAQFRGLAVALGKDDWLRDRRFATPASRDENRNALSDELAAVLLTETAQVWEDKLLSAGVPSARLRTLAEALDLPPSKIRAFAERGPAGYLGLPFKFRTDISQTEPRKLGADTSRILEGLNFSETEIEMLLINGDVG